MAKEKTSRPGLFEMSLRSVLSTPDGRRVFAYLVEDILALRGGSFTGNALESAYREGRRNAARHIEDVCMAVSREAYTAALIERLREREALDRPKEVPHE